MRSGSSPDGKDPKCNAKGTLATECRARSIEVQPRLADEKPDAGVSTARVDVWVCDTRHRVPEGLDASLPGGLPFVLDPGLDLRSDDYGMGGPHVELRLATKY